MGPGWDRTGDPWICRQLASVARHVTNCATGLKMLLCNKIWAKFHKASTVIGRFALAVCYKTIANSFIIGINKMCQKGSMVAQW